MLSIDEMLERDFGTIGELIRIHAQAAPNRVALVLPPRILTYADLDRISDEVAVGLARRGVGRRAVGDATLVPTPTRR